MKLRLILLALLAPSLLAVQTFAADNSVKIAESPAHIQYLTDAEGMTLYWFKNDRPGTSTCSGGCVANWPVFFRKTIEPAAGMKAADFGTITRADGRQQTTFRGYPLYYFAGDQQSGDMNGQGIINKWFTVDPDKFPM